MPIWIDVLLNVIGYAGFVGVAMFNTSSDTMQPSGALGEGGVS